MAGYSPATNNYVDPTTNDNLQVDYDEVKRWLNTWNRVAFAVRFVFAPATAIVDWREHVQRIGEDVNAAR